MASTQTSLTSRLSAPVSNALVDAAGKPLPPEKLYIPGTILQARVDASHPLAYGMPSTVDILCDNNPLFRLTQTRGGRRIAWSDSRAPLRSGWAWGQEYLNGAAALVVFRAHPHATFKFHFNGVYHGGAERVAL
jgi:hypothetical protein